jgi:hypothetical protein
MEDAAYRCSLTKLYELEKSSDLAEKVAAAAYRACSKDWEDYIDVSCRAVGECSPDVRVATRREIERRWLDKGASIVVDNGRYHHD